jgi:hypothetical protein
MAEELVGLGGFEPPTSRLSSARSNQLSYRPKPLRAMSPQGPCAPTGGRMTTKARSPELRKRNEDGNIPHFEARLASFVLIRIR